MKYFGMQCSTKYTNEKKLFSSYFLTLAQSDTKLEIMHSPEISEKKEKREQIGLAHFAIALNSKEAVDQLTSQIRNDGFEVLALPRYTGDGFYESVVCDMDGNRIEITIIQ